MDEHLRNRITIEPDKLVGAPAIRGQRIPVVTIIHMLGGGMSRQEILDAYPTLEADDIEAAVEFAIDAVESFSLPPVPAAG